MPPSYEPPNRVVGYEQRGASMSLSGTQLLRQSRIIIASSVGFLLAGFFCLLGGTEWLLRATGVYEDAIESRTPIFLAWPFSLFYVWPLVIPLGTYLVIARWTGYKHFRHA